ncbi:MAG: cytochrome c oxidase assembly protein [Alphaproteobacteria bacterium]
MTQGRKNIRLALACGFAAGAMIGVAYAAVPLYDAFCRVTGFGGTTQVAAVTSEAVLKRTMTVRFDANTARGLPWTFKPLQTSSTGRIGENMLAFYEVTNTSDKAVTGTATYNVTPQKAGLYFAKVDCFCFEEQTLEPGQTLRMAVSYFVDPALDEDPTQDDVKTITLSYTFFPKTGSGPAAD